MQHLPLIYFSRHGQTDWNVISRIQGSLDTDINALGRAQATGNGKKLKALIGNTASEFCFIASPLRRTCETMERIRQAMGFAEKDYLTDKRLEEICFGDWQGLRIEEIEQNRPQDYEARRRDKWHYLPGGAGAESYERLAERTKNWLESVQQKTVCVTHGGWMRTLFYHFAGFSKNEAANITIPQDKILKLENNRLEWL